VCADVFEYRPLRLASRRPIWTDMTFVDTIAQWREDWSSASSVVNHTIVTDPTIRQPGFDLPHHTWSLLNHLRTGQGPCGANLHKWGLAQSPSCDCSLRQTMDHIVDTCPLTKSEGGLNLLHEADDDPVMAGVYSDCSTGEEIAVSVQRTDELATRLNATDSPAKVTG